jgi:hypothetical protein
MADKSGWQVVPARPAHVARIAKRMRPHDVRECFAFGRSPKQALRAALAASPLSWTALLDGKPVAMFGLAPADMMSGVGAPWMLGTDEVPKGARKLLSWGPHFVEAMQREFPTLANYVSEENRQAHRLLRAFGFDIEADSVILGDLPFRRFQRVR